MIQIIVVTASVLLGMILYPVLLKKWRHFTEWLYWSSRGKPDDEKPEKSVSETIEKPSVIGKSKFNLRQSTPNTATDLENEKGIEKESTFVPEADEAPEIQDVDVPLEKVENLPEEEFDPEQEEIELETGQDAVLAGGVVYEELFKTHRVIEDHSATRQEEKDAGKVIYEQNGSGIFEQVAASKEENAMRISSLIDIFLKESAKEQSENSRYKNRQLESQDFKDFDVDSIF